MIYTIAFENQKGGVAKTTSCCNFAVGLYDLGKKVVVIDMDPQGTATKAFLKADDVYAMSVKECFEDAANTVKAILHTDSGVDLIPSSESPDILEGYKMEMMQDAFLGKRKTENRLKKMIREIRDLYDFCLIDCGPATDIYSLNACICSDLIIVPVMPVKKAIESFKATLNQINASREEFDCDNKYKILITMVNRNNNDRDYVRQLAEMFGEDCFDTMIRYQAKPVASADNSGKFVIRDVTKEAKVAQDYRDLVKEFLGERE